MLSVVVAAFNRPEILARCLAALAPQAVPGAVEVLVAGRADDQAAAAAVARVPGCRWLPSPPGSTIPALRAAGIAAARGEVVALLEDDCVVPAGWCDAIVAAHAAAPAVTAIGGAIEPDAYPTGLDWGVYFCEYVRFMAPFHGPVAALPGNNASYKRQRLLAAWAPTDAEPGFYDVFVHWRLQQAGEALLADARLAVVNVNRWGGRNVTAVPYHHGRAFAGMRARGRPPWLRPLWAMVALALPLLQTARHLREVLRRGRRVGRFLGALPWVLAFTASWGAGEFVGALAGPGDSASRWT